MCSMLFRLRQPAGLMERLRGPFWPRKGFIRPLHSLRMQVSRLTASPHAIAADVASGIISSLTPFKGFHFSLSCVLAYLMAGNTIAAVPGTASARRSMASRASGAPSMRANGLEIL